MALGDLKIRIGIDATGIEKGLRTAQKKLEKSASRFASIGSNISMGISAPLGVLGAQAISTAAEFETLEKCLWGGETHSPGTRQRTSRAPHQPATAADVRGPISSPNPPTWSLNPKKEFAFCSEDPNWSPN